MLVENKMKAGDIISLKLISGEEIIAKLIEFKKESLILYNPLTMFLEMIDHEYDNQVTKQKGKSQQAMVAFAPFMLGIDQNSKVTIDHSKYLAVSIARADAASQYKSAIGVVDNG